MPINVQCKGCNQKFQAPDQSAGKQVKCPKCSAPIDIPHPDEQTRITGKRAAQPAALKKAQQLSPEQLRMLEKKRAARREAIEAHLAEAPSIGTEAEPMESGTDSLEELAQTDLPEWHVQTDDGEEYGPVTKTELEEWVADGRLDQTCQVIHEDWDQWKWAEEVFPELAEAAEPEPDNPFAQWAVADSKADVPVVQEVAAPAFPEPDRATAAAPRISAPAGGRQRRYPVLTLIAQVYDVLVWVVGGVGLLAAVGVGLQFRQGMQVAEFVRVLTMELMVLLYTFIAVVSMKAMAEIIRLLFNIERDNQALAEATQQLAESLPNNEENA